jgi:hypothetical protein
MELERFLDAVIDEGAHQRAPRIPTRDALHRVRGRNGISVIAVRSTVLDESQLLSLLRYRFAQYLALGFFDPAVAFEQRMEHEPLSVVSPADVHYVASTAEGEILSYATLRAPPPAGDELTMRDRGRPRFPVEQSFGEGVFDRLAILPDVPVARVRELGRFVKNHRIGPLDERLTLAPVEVALAIGQTLVGPLRSEVTALVGGLEERVFKRVLDVLHFPTIVVHGALPYVAESSYYFPLYVRRLSYPFAVLCADISIERLAAIERALDAGATAVMALRQTAAARASSLEPPGGLPALTEASAPYADISMPVRRQMIDGGARLRASDAFAGMSTAEATALRRLMRRRCFGPGEAVVRRGDPGDALYVIEAGEADALVTDDRDRTRSARRMGQGDHFGEIALLGGGIRTSDVVAASALTVLELRRDDYERYLAEIGSVTGELARVAAARLAADARA